MKKNEATDNDPWFDDFHGDLSNRRGEGCHNRMMRRFLCDCNERTEAK